VDGWRLPAAALETAVAGLIADALAMPSLVRNAPAAVLRTLPSSIQSLTETLTGDGRGPLLRAFVAAGSIEPGRLSIRLDPAALAERLGVPPGHINEEALTLAGAFTLRRRGVEARLVLGETSTGVDRTLLRNVAQGWAWCEELKAGTTMRAIADREGVTQRRVARLIDLAFLAPDIVLAIVEGRQPVALTTDSLIKSPHRVLWSEQRAWLAAI
jgi:hypothetical protein